MERAKGTSKSLIGKLADAGEEAIARAAEAPGVGRVVESANAMRERVDELQLRVRGLEGIERRVRELERKVEELGRAAPPPPGPPSAAAGEPPPEPRPTPPEADEPGQVPGP